MRSVALMMPVLTDGDCSTSPTSVRPMAMAVWPTLNEAFLAALVTTSLVPTIFNSVSMRV